LIANQFLLRPGHIRLNNTFGLFFVVIVNQELLGVLSSLYEHVGEFLVLCNHFLLLFVKLLLV
jgi:hypothetical protein